MEDAPSPSATGFVSDATPILQTRRGPWWLMLSMVLVGLAAWAGMDAAKDKGTQLDSWAQQGPMLPTRGAERAGEREISDPISTYLERSKRGMTDLEIRWLIEDFQAAGLDEPAADLSEEATVIFRDRQHQWYLGALREGLCLNSEQTRAAKAKLGNLPITYTWMLEVWVDPSRNMEAKAWISDAMYAPWNLCELSQAQEKLTLKAWIDIDSTGDPFDLNSMPWHGWTSPGILTIQDPRTGNLSEWTETPAGMSERMEELLPIGNVFPLTPQQPLLKHPSDFLAQARLCQPAQLRMALLLDPSFAAKLQGLLEKAETQ